MTPPAFPDAPCTQADPEAWFPESTPTTSTAYAKRICHSCPHLEPCRTYGLTHPVDGIWGGLTGHERRIIRRQNRNHPTSTAA